MFGVLVLVKAMKIKHDDVSTARELAACRLKGRAALQATADAKARAAPA